MTLSDQEGNRMEEYEGFVQEVIKGLDVDRRVAHLSSDLIKPQLQDWRADHEGEPLPDEVRWEKLALDVYAVDRRHRQGSAQERFHPMCTFRVGDSDPPEVRAYPDVDGLLADEHAISYYRKRTEDTPNPVRRARYADILYCALARRGGNVFEYGMEAARAYLAQVPLCIEQERHAELVANLDRAAEFAVLFSNSDLAAEAVEQVQQALNVVVSREGFAWAQLLCDTVIYLSENIERVVDRKVWKKIEASCDEGIAHCIDSGNWHLARAFMHLGARVAESIGKESKAWDYRVRVPESLEEQSRRRESDDGPAGGSLPAFTLMEDASRAYQRCLSLAPTREEKARIRDKMQETQREVRRLIQQAEQDMSAHEVSIPIPRKVLEKELIEPLLAAPSEDTFMLLAHCPDLVPDMDDIRAQAAETAEQHPLHYLISQIRLRDGRKVDETSLQNDESAQLTEHLGYWFQVQIRLLDIVLRRLREEGQFTASSFMQHIEQWQLVSERDLPFIQKGVERYFSDDFISALHTLTPRIEHMLKSALEQVGISPVAVPNERQVREQTLGTYLHRHDVQRNVGESIWHYLDYALVNERGLNLRNDVAHGWVVSPQCNRMSVQVILFAILLLTRLHTVEARVERIDE
jgi:hypothetical protein